MKDTTELQKISKYEHNGEWIELLHFDQSYSRESC